MEISRGRISVRAPARRSRMESIFTRCFSDGDGRREDISEEAWKERNENIVPFSFWRSRYEAPAPSPLKRCQRMTLRTCCGVLWQSGIPPRKRALHPCADAGKKANFTSGRIDRSAPARLRATAPASRSSSEIPSRRWSGFLRSKRSLRNARPLTSSVAPVRFAPASQQAEDLPDEEYDQPRALTRKMKASRSKMENATHYPRDHVSACRSKVLR